MTFAPSLIPRGWGLDTNTKLSSDSARALWLAPDPGQPKVCLWRYVSLGIPSQADITPDERDAILACWPALGLVQHVNYPRWQGNSILGTTHGQAAVRHADWIGYPSGCHLALDMEGLGNSGDAVYDYIAYWADEAHGSSFQPFIYDGYDDGMPDSVKTKLVTRGIVRPMDWWSDFGPRALPVGLSYTQKQHVQTTLAGVQVDRDEVLTAGVLSLMSLSPAAQAA